MCLPFYGGEESVPLSPFLTDPKDTRVIKDVSSDESDEDGSDGEVSLKYFSLYVITAPCTRQAELTMDLPLDTTLPRTIIVPDPSKVVVASSSVVMSSAMKDGEMAHIKAELVADKTIKSEEIAEKTSGLLEILKVGVEDLAAAHGVSTTTSPKTPAWTCSLLRGWTHQPPAPA